MSKKERIKSFNPAIALLPDTKHYNNLLSPVLKDKCSLLPIKGYVFDLFWMESTIIMNPMVNECLKGILICLKWFLCPQINQWMIVEQYNRMYVLVLMLKMQSREHCNIVARCIFNVRKKKKKTWKPLKNTLSTSRRTFSTGSMHFKATVCDRKWFQFTVICLLTL